MDLHYFKQSTRSMKQGKSSSKAMKPVSSAIKKDGKYSLQHEVVDAAIEKKKVKEKEVFDKPNPPRKNSRPKKKKKKAVPSAP